MARHFHRFSGEPLAHFNSVIATHIRLLFEEFVPNPAPLPELTRNCSPKRTLPPAYERFTCPGIKLHYVEVACTLSMFINLYCRLNHSSLTLGVEQLFQEEPARLLYLEYLEALTQKVLDNPPTLSERDKEVLKVDVYGNLVTLLKGTPSPQLLHRLVSLAKKLLRVNTDLRGVNKLPVKLLAHKATASSVGVDL